MNQYPEYPPGVFCWDWKQILRESGRQLARARKDRARARRKARARKAAAQADIRERAEASTAEDAKNWALSLALSGEAYAVLSGHAINNVYVTYGQSKSTISTSSTSMSNAARTFYQI